MESAAGQGSAGGGKGLDERGDWAHGEAGMDQAGACAAASASSRARSAFGRHPRASARRFGRQLRAALLTLAALKTILEPSGVACIPNYAPSWPDAVRLLYGCNAACSRM
jgi:hypothetical protein